MATLFCLDLPTDAQQLPYPQLPITATALCVVETCVAYHIPLFVITASSEEALHLQRACQFFNPTLPCFIFPDWETLPYDHFSPHQDIVSERLRALKQLPELQEGIVIAPIILPNKYFL
jgi:transcription-repair coupling factor (superfamily II helicase)